jgi:predicted N-acyltransferase
MPVVTHSLHWIADPGFRAAIARYLAQEARAIDSDIGVLASYGPFRHTVVEEQE